MGLPGSTRVQELQSGRERAHRTNSILLLSWGGTQGPVSDKVKGPWWLRVCLHLGSQINTSFKGLCPGALNYTHAVPWKWTRHSSVCHGAASLCWGHLGFHTAEARRNSKRGHVCATPLIPYQKWVPWPRPETPPGDPVFLELNRRNRKKKKRLNSRNDDDAHIGLFRAHRFKWKASNYLQEWMNEMTERTLNK